MKEVPCNLRDCLLCKSCVPEWKEIIAIRKKTLLFRKGKQVFAEGEKVRGIYFVYSGSVKVHKLWGDQKELIIRFAKTGDILGHRGFAEAAYPVSATTLEETTLCFISNELLEASLKTGHEFTYRLMQCYATELQKAEKRMRNLAHMEVKGRIAEALLEIQQLFGLNKENYIAETVTRQDIASYAGTTYETVFKFFNELNQENIITTTGKQIKINEPERLMQFIKG